MLPAYMIGPAYSGSSLLGNALNAHPRISYAGEALRELTLGHPAEDWNCWLCLSRDQPCPVWSGATVAEIQSVGPAGALDVVARRTGSEVVVDGSKDVRTLWDAGAGRSDARVLLVVRSPFAYVDSACREERFEPWVGANFWRDTVADAMRTINTLGLPSMVVRYEAFAATPEPVLRRICGFLGVEWDPAMLQFWERPVHAVAGNPGAYAWYPGFTPWWERQVRAVHEGRIEDAPFCVRNWFHAYADQQGVDRAGLRSASYDKTVTSYATRSFGGWVDDKWRRRLDAAALRAIMGTPDLPDLASLLGYDLAELLIGGPSTA